MSRQFTASKAVRERVPLLIGLMGPSGGGKTYSALRLATGIREVVGGDIWVIDTEGSRAKHYAPKAGDVADPSRGTFDFMHLPFGAPFASIDYLAAIKHCVAQGAQTVVIDSMSHEHEGEGGMVAAHDAKLNQLAGNDWKKRKACQFLAWVEPKANRRALLNGILQLNVNLIFCFRAKEKLKLEKGKKEPVPLGWMPISGAEFIYEMTACALLLPGANGKPTWRPQELGERQMVKQPGWSEKMFSKQLDEATGAKLARWAEGSTTIRDPLKSAMVGALVDDAKQGASAMPESAIALLATYQAVTTLDDYTIAEDERRDLWGDLDGVAKAALKGESIAAFARVEADDTPPAPETT